MKIVREILVLSVNTDWSHDLKKTLEGSNKIRVDVAGSRTVATKFLTDNEYEAVVIEDTFELKNMDYFLRAVSSQHQKPKFVFFTFADSSLFTGLKQTDALSEVTFRFHSLPLPIQLLRDVIFLDLLPMNDSNSSFDREFTQVLIEAGQSVLESLNVSDIKALRPQLLTKMSQPPVSDIRGKIIIKSEFFSGSLLIAFEEKVFKSLYKCAVGEDVTEINSEVEDFAGEIANMVYGQAKKVLERNGIKLDMAIPIVDRESNLNVSTPIFVIPLDTSIGTVFIKIAPKVY